MASNIREKFHDPVFQRGVFVREIIAFIVDFLKPYRILGIQSDEQLLRLQNTIEMDVYKFGVSKGQWDKRELPLRVKLQYFQGKMHVDLDGPLGGEVYVAMLDYMNFTDAIGPVNEGHLEDDAWDDDDDDDVEDTGFRYGR